jgi:hypothetical protein
VRFAVDIHAAWRHGQRAQDSIDGAYKLLVRFQAVLTDGTPNGSGASLKMKKTASTLESVQLSQVIQARLKKRWVYQRVQEGEGSFAFDRYWQELDDGVRLHAHLFTMPTKKLFWHRHAVAIAVFVLGPGYTLHRAQLDGPQVLERAPRDRHRLIDPSSYQMTEPADYHAVEILKTPLRTFMVSAPFGALPDFEAADMPQLDLLHEQVVDAATDAR